MRGFRLLRGGNVFAVIGRGAGFRCGGGFRGGRGALGLGQRFGTALLACLCNGLLALLFRLGAFLFDHVLGVLLL